MNKPSNWWSMDQTERREWEKNKRAIEDAEYDRQRAQEQAEYAEQQAQQARRKYRQYIASAEEEMSYMYYDLEAKNNRIAELESALKAYMQAHDTDEMELEKCECDLCQTYRPLVEQSEEERDY